MLAEKVMKKTLESQTPCVTDGGKQMSEGQFSLRAPHSPITRPRDD